MLHICIKLSFKEYYFGYFYKKQSVSIRLQRSKSALEASERTNYPEELQRTTNKPEILERIATNLEDTIVKKGYTKRCTKDKRA